MTSDLTTEALDRLHAAADGRGEFGRVRKEDLMALLIERSQMINAMLKEGVPYE